VVTYAPINQVATGSSSSVPITDSGTLVIESDAASSPNIIDLTGSSTAVTLPSPSNTAPLVTFTPSQSSLTFASTLVSTTSPPQTVTLANTGTATINILGIQTTPDFTIASNCSTIVPGASCALAVTFTPQASTQSTSFSQTRIGAIEISSNSSTSLEFISLVGISSPSTLTVAPASLSFGTVLVGANTSLSLQLTNSSSAPASIISIAATGDFAASIGSCPPAGTTLAVGASCTAQITFAPTQSGTRTGTLSIANSASAQPLTVPLTGNGTQSHLQITPSSLGFGSVAVGSSSRLSLTLTNVGTAPVAGMSLAIAGDYAITTPCNLATLAPLASCSATIAFTPSSAGTHTASLTITSSDASSPDTVALTGTGFLNVVVSPSFTLTASGSGGTSATVASGLPATYTLTVTPLSGFTGAVTLNCAAITAASYAACSLLPASVVLGAAQPSVVTISTVTEIAADRNPVKLHRSFDDSALCLLFPVVIFSWKRRASRPAGPIAWAILAAIALLSASGCGSNSIAASALRYTPAGTYQYQVTASATSGTAPISQAVTLNLIVQ
jgi:hypothetical protein